ncbi:MAG: hybrid sensor histidine kinase/response regulator, partial [Hyphomicrobiales bacterium]
VNGANTAQTSIIGADGYMITSTGALHPTAPLYLGDREHFRVHARAAKDELFISKPVIGRVSHKWSVQLSRRLTDATGHFAGVAVASLDAISLARDFESLNRGGDGGSALVGDDGVVRAGSGAYAGQIGSPFAAKQPTSDEPGETRGFITAERRTAVRRTCRR